MKAILSVAPATEPITLNDLKDHLRIDDEESDVILTSLITTARVQVEDTTRRALISQTWDYYLQEWPKGNVIKLPFGNLISVTSIKWKDSDATETTLAVTTDYLVETNGDQCGAIVLPYGKAWPSGTLYPSNPIIIKFVCGYTSAATVPDRIKTAIKMLAAALYENRGEAVIGQTVSEDKMLDRLLYPCRLWDEFP